MNMQYNFFLLKLEVENIENEMHYWKIDNIKQEQQNKKLSLIFMLLKN